MLNDGERLTFMSLPANISTTNVDIGQILRLYCRVNGKKNVHNKADGKVS